MKVSNWVDVRVLFNDGSISFWIVWLWHGNGHGEENGECNEEFHFECFDRSLVTCWRAGWMWYWSMNDHRFIYENCGQVCEPEMLLYYAQTTKAFYLLYPRIFSKRFEWMIILKLVNYWINKSLLRESSFSCCFFPSSCHLFHFKIWENCAKHCKKKC